MSFGKMFRRMDEAFIAPPNPKMSKEELAKKYGGGVAVLDFDELNITRDYKVQDALLKPLAKQYKKDAKEELEYTVNAGKSEVKFISNKYDEDKFRMYVLDFVQELSFKK